MTATGSAAEGEEPLYEVCMRFRLTRRFRMPFHNLRRAYFTGEKFVPDPGSLGGGEELFDYQSIIDQIARDHAEKAPEEQFATAEGDVTFEQLIEQFDMENGQEAEPQPVPLPSALDGNAPSTEQPFGGIDMEPLSRISDEDEGAGPMEPVPGMDDMDPGMDLEMGSGGLAEYIHKQIQMELGKTDEDAAPGELPSKDDLIPDEDDIAGDEDYEGAFDEAEGILGPENGDIDLGVPVAEDEDSDFDLGTDTDDALEGGEMEEIFPDDEEGAADDGKDYGLASAILKGKERQKAAGIIARRIVADTVNIDFTFNDEGKPEVDIDDEEVSGDEDLFGDEGEDEGDDLFGEEEGEGEEDLFGEGAEPKGKGDDLFDELGGGGEGDLFGEEEGGEGGGEDFLGI